MMPNTNHSCPEEEAIVLTKNYREKYPDQSRCEFFSRDAFEDLLANPEVIGIRIYYGLDDAGKQHLVMVGVEECECREGNCDDLSKIKQGGLSCPSFCPKANPLNPQ